MKKTNLKRAAISVISLVVVFYAFYGFTKVVEDTSLGVTVFYALLMWVALNYTIDWLFSWLGDKKEEVRRN